MPRLRIDQSLEIEYALRIAANGEITQITKIDFSKIDLLFCPASIVNHPEINPPTIEMMIATIRRRLNF